ncbi:MAG: hypothetical protein JST54_05495 [Deltaproteobacteria bacterium]|nr:hypothetical protein [Deltaproteobacteria bacterium]
MVSPFPRISLALPLFAIALVLSDCKCHKDTPLQKAGVCASGAKSCSKDADCPDHDACTAEAGENCCEFAARTCKQSSDCCPGQICKRDGHCFDQRIECPNGDSDCGDPGSDRVCLTYTDGQGKTDQVCGYAPCDATHACDTGLSCFRGFCVASPPCSGHCDDGNICIPQTNTCWDYGDRCQISCGAGFLPMETDPNNIWDSCNNHAVTCECDELPPLTSNDLGRYSASTAMSDGHVAVSMYDGQYGDLVVRYYDNTGAVTATEYVDGVPDGGTIVAGPSGPRGGISDPGSNVGEYTSIVADSTGRLFVSYYDVDHGDLKLAIRGTDKSWTTQTVDSNGDVGLYTSIALDPSGKPVIAYFQRAGATGSTQCPGGDNTHPDLVTGVKLAKASSANPAHPSDWSTSFVECAAIPAPNCYGCGSGQVCVTDSNGNGVCSQSASGCGICGSGNVCANDGSGAACATLFTAKPLLNIPAGVGLYPSVAFNGSSIVVAYYDHLNKVLRAATGTGTLSPVTIDDGCSANASTCDDVGMFSNLAVEPGGQHRIAIAYHDATTRGLKLYLGTTLALTTNPSDAVIDDGHEPATGDGPSYVGGNVHLKFAADGTLWAAYHNSTGNDLRLAQHGTSSWTVKKKWTQGAVGWFASASQLTGATKLYIAHAQLHTKLQQGHPVKDTTPHLEFYDPTSGASSSDGGP